VQTHRDPIEVIPSYCSMMQAIMSIRSSVDPLALGPIVLEYLARSLERGMSARERRERRSGTGVAGRSRFLDVDYRTFVAAPLEETARVYAHFDLDFDATTEAAMRRFLDENPQGKHGAHRYSLEEYGLSAGAVRERLRFYTERFGLDAVR
jgi:hypothetical protein